uniref:Uncharacterized protein n=1 Tax=Oryza rufipogon TaxID=4529 RepID=A0A0E0QI81_ORYRU
MADTIKKRDFNNEPGHWSLRPLWSQIQRDIAENLFQVAWIPWKINKVADKVKVKELGKIGVDLYCLVGFCGSCWFCNRLV